MSGYNEGLTRRQLFEGIGSTGNVHSRCYTTENDFHISQKATFFILINTAETSDRWRVKSLSNSCIWFTCKWSVFSSFNQMILLLCFVSSSCICLHETVSLLTLCLFHKIFSDCVRHKQAAALAWIIALFVNKSNIKLSLWSLLKASVIKVFGLNSFLMLAPKRRRPSPADTNTIKELCFNKHVWNVHLKKNT